MSAPALTGLRWSSARDCPRKAAGETLDVEPRPFTDREARILFRGKRIEDDYADWLQREHPDWTLERQREIRWPFGTGHVDIYAVEAGLFFEVLSSANPSAAMVDSKLVQLAGYMEHDRAATGGVLAIVNPVDFSEERVPVARGTVTYRALAGEVEARVAALAAWRETGELPARVCRRPSDSFGHFCRLAKWCFAGWEPPSLDEIGRPEVAEWAARWYAAKGEERAAQTVFRDREAARKEIESELDELAVPAGEWQAGPWRVRRTRVERKPTLDARVIEGELPEVPAHWWRPGASYDRVDVQPATPDGAPADGGYGDDPPF